MKKQLIRRSVRDRSRQWRLGVQLSFLTLNLWIGLQFYLWARYYETGGRSLRVARPGGVEGWLPIAALMNLKFLIGTGHVQGSHAAGMFILIAFLLISVLLRKAFCGWLFRSEPSRKHCGDWAARSFAAISPSRGGSTCRCDR